MSDTNTSVNVAVYPSIIQRFPFETDNETQSNEQWKPSKELDRRRRNNVKRVSCGIYCTSRAV